MSTGCAFDPPILNTQYITGFIYFGEAQSSEACLAHSHCGGVGACDHRKFIKLEVL